MKALTIDAAQGADLGPMIRSEGFWATLFCHRHHIEQGMVALSPHDQKGAEEYWADARVNFKGAPSDGADPVPNMQGTADPIAVEIARQWRALLDAGEVPLRGAIQLKPLVNVAAKK